MSFIRTALTIALTAAAITTVAVPASAFGLGIDFPHLTYPSDSAPTTAPATPILPSTKG